MTSVFDEKKKKRKEPTGNEIDTIKQMHDSGMSLRKIAEQTGYSESVLKPIFPQMKKTGSKSKEQRITKDEVREAYIHILEEQKQKNKKALGENPTRQQIIKATGIKNLHALTLAYLTKKGWDISDSTLRRNFAKIDFEKEIQGETVALPHEIQAKILKKQEEYKLAILDKEWIDKTTEDTRIRTQQNLEYINELISWRHGEWENIDPNDIDDNEKLSKIFHNKNLPKPRCIKPKPIAISEWTHDDIMWALLYIDWVGETAQYHFRGAINRLTDANPALRIKQNPLKHLGCKTSDYSRATYHTKFAIEEERAEQMQEPKTGKFKKPPSREQVQKMFQILNKKQFQGKSFLNLKDKNGNTAKLSKKDCEELERETVKLAINIAARTGMRGGHQRKTEMGSLRFDDIYWDDSKINAATKTSHRKKVLTKVNPDVIHLIKDFKNKLEKKDIDTSKMYIISIPIQNLNNYLRELAEDANVCKYKKEYGEYRIIPGAKGKKYLHVFKKGEPGYEDPRFLHYQMNFQNQKITVDPSDPDPHLHLFRAFHLWELAKAGVPLQYAIKMSYGWDDPKTAIDYYMAALQEEELEKYRPVEQEIFSVIT